MRSLASWVAFSSCSPEALSAPDRLIARFNTYNNIFYGRSRCGAALCVDGRQARSRTVGVHSHAGLKQEYDVDECTR
jgi:hypothetical protein